MENNKSMEVFAKAPIRKAVLQNALPAMAAMLMVLIYAICMVLICMHVRHGFWSAFATLGANTSATSRKIWNGLAYFIAVLLYVGFMIAPLAVAFGWVK